MIASWTSADGPWAKLSHGPDGEIEAWHSLVDHSADVAACFEAILALPIPSRRIAKLAGRDELPECWIDRLCAHVALHDFGKANSGFQARSRVGAPLIGHCREAWVAVQDEDIRARLASVLPWAEMEQWGHLDPVQLVVLAHHGRPLAPVDFDQSRLAHWRCIGGFDPVQQLRPLGDAVRSWYPKAFQVDGEPLPTAPAFWHGLLGYITLADWLGSDTRFFPFANGREPDRIASSRIMARKALQAIGFDPSSSRVSLASRPLAFSAVSEHPPRDVQTATGSFEGNVVVLESETGSGKTEAALWRFARLFEAGEVDGLYFALPTRVAATSLHERVSKAVETLFPDPAYRPAVTMAVPGMVAPTNDQQTGTELCGSPDLTESPADMRSASMWASEGPKRYLAGTIAVGTIDQVLLASLNAKHAHLRLSALARLLLVVDEVHASDAYMASLLGNLLAFHRRAGGHALLLSATLGSNARDSLLGTPRRSVPFEQAVAAPYPALSSNACPDPLAQPGNGRDRTIAIQLDTRIGDPAAVAGIAIKAAGLGAKVLVIRNLRRDAIKVLEECKLAGAQDLLFKCGGVATLHHGRFAREDRRALDRAVEGAIGLKRPAGGTIVIGTQTLEQSLDIDADLLISDICPADVLLQRLGRLHRHDRGRRPAGFEAPRAVVMAPNDLAGLYHRGEHGIGLFQSNGQSTPYPYSDVLAVEATRQAIVDYPSWEIPIMNRLLVELATHPEARASLLDRLDPSGGWEESDAIVTGRGAAYKLQAGYAHLPFDSAFDDQAVVMSDDPLSTRLGEKDLLVQFPERLPGPFGSPVSSIAIPHFWMRGLNGLDEPVPTEIRRSTDGFSFQFGSSRFVYDAMGVRPEK